MTMRRCFAVALLVLSWPALARQVELPLTFGFPLLRQTLLAELFTEPNATARVRKADGGCSDLVLSDPQVDGQAGRLRDPKSSRSFDLVTPSQRCKEAPMLSTTAA